MNDAERDAWLREALRHAPDAGALPPRGVSDAILAEARAKARQDQAVPPRAARAAARHPLAVFWDWLARPPVAASFATVMAATLVGLMWWDRPMDETVPRRPEAASERATLRPPHDVASAPSAAPVTKNEPAPGPAAQTSLPSAEPRPADAGAKAEVPQPRRQLPIEQGAARLDAKVATPSEGDKRKLRDAVVAKESAAGAERKAVKPSPFPAAEEERRATPASPALAKKDADDRLARSAGAAPPTGAAVAESSIAAAAPPPAPARPPESARARAAPDANSALAARRPDEPQPQTSTAPTGALDAAKSAAAAPAAQPAPALRSGALPEAREKQASAYASPPAATRNELATGQSETRSATASPLAAVLASIGREPERWSRTSASGSVVALDAGWRDWLARLDAAANGRWRRVDGDGGAATSGERDGATTLRLVSGGQAAGAASLDGTSVRVDDVAPGEHWQAILPRSAAEQLRTAAGNLRR